MTKVSPGALQASRIGAATRRVFLGRLRDLWQDRQGVGAVEFALIAPMLLVVYLMAFELTIGMSIAKKTSMASSTIGDLVSREEKVNKAFLVTTSDVAKAMFVPYPSNNLLIKITGIKVDDKESAKVAWSWSSTGVAPYVVNSTPTVPSDLTEPDIFLVRTELSVSHELLMWLPGLTGSSTKTLTLSREFFFRQRLSKDITCDDC